MIVRARQIVRARHISSERRWLEPAEPARLASGDGLTELNNDGASELDRGTLSQRDGGRGDAAVNEDGPDVREGHTGWEEAHVTWHGRGCGHGRAMRSQEAVTELW